MAQYAIPFRPWMDYTDESVKEVEYPVLFEYRRECRKLMWTAEKKGQIEVYKFASKFFRLINKEMHIRDISPRGNRAFSQEKAAA